jgi:hypothetical protein
MKFTRLVAIIATCALAMQAKAQEGAAPEINGKDVTININTASAQQPSTASQPVTTVEAAPATESHAEALRRQRQQAEMNTEQKIVEKLEDERLQEENARAERLFGSKKEQQQQAAPVVAPVVAPAPTPAPAPVVTTPAPAPTAAAPAPVPAQPQQVTIEKVEIIQPPAPIPTPVEKSEPAAETTKAEADKIEDEAIPAKFYVGALLGNLSYGSDNVKSNYGLGVDVGTILQNHWALGLSYLYSNSNINDYWYPYQLFHTMNQSDLTAYVKYYILSDRLKPYVGGSVSWVNRQYTDQYLNYNGGYTAAGTTSTNAIDAGLLGGVDFAITPKFMLGLGAAYNFNVATTNDINFASYNMSGSGIEPLEKMSYWTFLISAKFVF